MFPWFTTKTTFNRENIGNSNMDYWADYDNVERDWDKTTYWISDYEMESSVAMDWERNGMNTTSSSGRIEYASSAKDGGWEGSYSDMARSDHPVPGFLAGGDEQLNVYTYTYYLIIFSIIMAIVGIICAIVAGLGKMSPVVPKVIVGITAALVVIAPLYFALALPPAINGDFESLQDVSDPLGNRTAEAPPQGGSSIMGEANERGESGTGALSHIEWGPELGWWLSIVAIFTTIVTIAFIEGKKPKPPTTPDHMKRKYHEFDDRPRPRGRDYPPTYDQEYIPPPSRRRSAPADDYYQDDYGGARRDDYYDRPPMRPGTVEQPRQGPRDDYYDDHGRRPPPPRRPPRRRPPPSY